MANVAIGDALIALILLLTSVATLRKLKQMKPQMSASTKYMQSQMNRLMFAEATSLCGVILVPFGMAMIMLYART
ncbi:hypothetical protein AAVH_20137 [Aphelenchoides avenae]|nr:hypothetical protein AAVH_33418 [Aphelenchus avenae]KAH7712536.1 hypothetical protein AAVH_20137 [Aphelenchus avenae]